MRVCNSLLPDNPEAYANLGIIPADGVIVVISTVPGMLHICCRDRMLRLSFSKDQIMS